MKKFNKLSVLGLATAIVLNCAACGAGANAGSAGAGSDTEQQVQAGGVTDNGLYTETSMQNGDTTSDDIMQKIFDLYRNFSGSWMNTRNS